MGGEQPLDEKALHPATLGLDVLLQECRVEHLRRSGPGGQRRNKVETGVRLRHRPTGVRAQAFERRNQAENQQAALRRLRLRLALEVRCSPQPERGPSPLWQSRCRGGRIDVSASHDDFPALLAEALDRIATRNGDLAEPAAALGCTASQLLKLLRKEARALALVNQWRGDRGLGRLR
jgi:hypothetical protein